MYSKNLRACSSLYPIKHSDITTDVNPGDSEPYYLVLADKYSVDAPAPPSPDTVIVQVGPVYFSQTGNVRPVSFSVPAGYWISSIIVDDYIGTNTGTTYLVVGRGGVLTANTSVGVDLCAGHGYLWQQSGTLSITLLYTDSGNEGDGEIFLNVNCVPTDTVMAQWRSNVWTALYNAGQSQFYAQQQTTSAQISALKNQINNADTLTLRREENDEIMKCVLPVATRADNQFRLHASQRSGRIHCGGRQRGRGQPPRRVVEFVLWSRFHRQPNCIFKLSTNSSS